MKELLSRILRRIAFLTAIVVTPIYTIVTAGTPQVYQNILDVVAMAFASAVMILNWKRFSRFFTNTIVGEAQVHFLSVQGMMLALMLAAASAMQWRASGHLASVNDGPVRVIYRTIYDISTIGFFITAGEYQDNISYGRLGKVALIIVAVVAFAIFLLTQDPDRSWHFTPRTPVVVPDMEIR